MKLINQSHPGIRAVDGYDGRSRRIWQKWGGNVGDRTLLNVASLEG